MLDSDSYPGTLSHSIVAARNCHALHKGGSLRSFFLGPLFYHLRNGVYLKSILSIVSIVLFAVPSTSQGREVTTVCYRSGTAADARFFVIARPQSLLSDHSPVLFALFVDALKSIQGRQNMSIDMRFCNDGLFTQSVFGCQEADDPVTLRIGYNGRFRDDYGNWWEVDVANDLEFVQQYDTPVSYGTLFGDYMFQADWYLKTELLRELQLQARTNDILLPADGTMTFYTTNGDLRKYENNASGLTAYQVDINTILGVEADVGILSRELGSFVTRILSSRDEAKEVRGLRFAFAGLFVAHQLTRCGGTSGTLTYEFDSVHTPTEIVSIHRQVYARSAAYDIVGGVRTDLWRFEDFPGIPSFAADDRALVDSIPALVAEGILPLQSLAFGDEVALVRIR